MNKAQQKRQTKYEVEAKTHCPFCLAPLIEEFGVKRCQNLNCTYKVERQIKQTKLWKQKK